MLGLNKNYTKINYDNPIRKHRRNKDRQCQQFEFLPLTKQIPLQVVLPADRQAVRRVYGETISGAVRDRVQSIQTEYFGRMR